jgi:hypothetical protein
LERVERMNETERIIGMELGLRTAVKDRRFGRDPQDVQTWLEAVARLDRGQESRRQPAEDSMILGYLVGYRLGLSAWDGEAYPVDRLKEFLSVEGIILTPSYLGAA